VSFVVLFIARRVAEGGVKKWLRVERRKREQTEMHYALFPLFLFELFAKNSL